MFPKLLLGLAGAVFLVYGVVCWIDPELPAEYAGLFIATHNGYAEMAATYGGLQASLGAILVASAFLKPYQRPGLWLMLICIGSVAAARGSIAFGNMDSSFNLGNSALGIKISSGFTAYTWGSLAFEITLAVLAAIALIRSR